MRLMIKILRVLRQSKSTGYGGKGGGGKGGMGWASFYLAGASSWLLIYDLFVWVARL